MATIADKLTTIAGIKSDIRTAINGKGGSLTSGSPFSAYSAAISSLPSGGGGYPPDWSEIGYTGTPQAVLDAFSHAKTIFDNWNPTVTSLENKFSGDTNLFYMPIVETSGVTNMKGMFYGCTNLSVVPQMNTSACTSMSGMYMSCNSITSVPLLDTSKVTNMAFMYSGCNSLKMVPLFNTSACTDMSHMFGGCSGLTSIPQFNTSACTNMGNMFTSCYRLTSIPAFDTSACGLMGYMFYNCSGLTSIPALNTSGVTSMNFMFSGCKSLQKITSLDISKVTNISKIFQGTGSNLRFMLLKGLGTPSGMTSYTGTGFEWCSVWGVDSTDIPDARQSLVDTLLTYSFDRATAGYATCTIKLSSNSYGQLTAQELADIQAKGYNITT